MDADLDRDVTLAMQHALLPAQLPIVDGVELSASYEPPDAPAGAGGDFYDAFVRPDGRLALVVGDAAGSGRPAVLAMNHARLGLRAALLDGCPPVDALRRANALLLGAGTERPVSATVALLDPTTLHLRYACAGHVPPIVASATGARSLAGAGSGIPMGIVADHLAAELVAALPEDALGALFTAGFLDPDATVEHGLGALADALAAARALGAPNAAHVIAGARFGDRPRAHDATILTFRPTPALGALAIRLAAEPPNATLARVAVRRFLNGCSFDERRAYDALVAVGEAIANAVEHAYGAHSERRFGVSGARFDDRLEIVVTDNGHWREATVEPGRGRGIPLMRELADHVSIATGEDGTSVTLTFARGTNVPDDALGVRP